MEISAKLFFSYARADSEFALRLAKDLRSAGAKLWIDQLDISPGARWDQAVEEALKSCSAVLVVLSSTSVQSDNVLDEIFFAIDQNKRVIPVRCQDCDIPLRLRRFQYVDFAANYANGLAQLQSTLTAPGFSQEPRPLLGKHQFNKRQTFVIGVVAGLVLTILVVGFITRPSGSWQVRVTYSPQSAVLQLGGQRIGVLPDTVVNFAGAANSPYDVTVSWDFHLVQPCGPPVPNARAYDKAAFQKEMLNAFDIATGKLITPTLAVLQDWINMCPGSQNWLLTATSNQDRSKYFRYNLKFCRTLQDCPAP